KGHIWPPHSPDINPRDNFLWGLLKEPVFRQHPGDLLELRACIVQVCNTIYEDLFLRVGRNMSARLELLRQNGGHIEHVLS
ncbi:Transposable element Tc3 transposase, partial [Blattella germanica]